MSICCVHKHTKILIMRTAEPGARHDVLPLHVPMPENVHVEGPTGGAPVLATQLNLLQTQLLQLIQERTAS
jgi:hypothetical protein